MKLIKTLNPDNVTSGHTLAIFSITEDELPATIKKASDGELYDKWYVVKNWDAGGVPFMYLCKGHYYAPNEVHGYYRNGGFWTGFGKNLIDAINGMQRDGWQYA